MGEFDGLLQGVVRQAQAANQPENGDYYDDEGFLVCGNCHTRRQVEVNMPDLKAVPFDPKKKIRVKMPVSCRCRAERHLRRIRPAGGLAEGEMERITGDFDECTW